MKLNFSRFLMLVMRINFLPHYILPSKKKLISFSLMLMLFTLGQSATSLAQCMSGTYTVNDGAPTSGTNFNSFSDMTTALNTMGVCGPVVINVNATSGPYNERLTLGSITGASATNTIRINGNGRTLQSSISSSYTGMLMLNCTEYLTIDSLTFKTLSSNYGFGAILYGGCDYDSVVNCTFDLTSVSSNSSSACSGMRITYSASGTSSVSSGATNTYIGYNEFLGTTGSGGPYYNWYLYGPNSDNVY